MDSIESGIGGRQGQRWRVLLPLSALLVAAGCGALPQEETAAALPDGSDGPVLTIGCESYPASQFGLDPNTLADTGGGSQLVTVVGPRRPSKEAQLMAWQLEEGCWNPASITRQPLGAHTGRGGIMPLEERVPGNGATPAGLFAFGDTIYGLSKTNPNPRYAYHNLECGDWWVEQPSSSLYDTFQHVPCDTTPSYGRASEKLWTYIKEYQKFIHIDVPNPPAHAAGIFLHANGNTGHTAGCISLPEDQLDAVLGWLDPDQRPHIAIDIA